MPPKKSNSKSITSKKKKVKELSPEEIERNELQQLAEETDNLIENEQQLFVQHQQNREKINYFWIIEKKKCDDLKSELRNKQRELQDLQEKQMIEINIYKNKVKYLLQEKNHQVFEHNYHRTNELNHIQDTNLNEVETLFHEKLALVGTMNEAEFQHGEYTRMLKREQDSKITSIRHDFEKSASDIIKSYESKMKKLREQLDKQRKDEVKSIEDKKEALINKLLTENAKALADIKFYYSDITYNNLDLIKTLKEELKELEIEQKKDKIKLHRQLQENKKLSQPLKQMQGLSIHFLFNKVFYSFIIDDLLKLKEEYKEYDKEKQEMKSTKTQLALVENEYKKLSWEHETLFQKFSIEKTERDNLLTNLQSNIFDIKQKSSFQSLLLEKKVNIVEKVKDVREIQLNEILKNFVQLSPVEMEALKSNVKDIVELKSNELNQLENEYHRIAMKQQEFNKALIQKLQEYDLKVDELGFDLPQVSHLNSS